MDSLIIFTQIFLINMLLSGDNAIIIAMTSKQLPKEQRNKAIWWGTIAAVVLRCLLVLVALPLMSLPYIQGAGGIILLYIAVKLLMDLQHQEQQLQHNKQQQLTFLGAIWTILAADFVMSLDNVLAISAIAKGDFILIMLGIAVSIPMIVWGSKLLNNLLKKYPSISYIGAGCLGFAAGEMIIQDKGIYSLFLYKVSNFVELIPLFCVPLVICLAILRLKTAKA